MPVWSSSEPYIIFNGYSIDVEIADTPEKWEQWLMYRNSLDKDKGMLFVFYEEDNYEFWMKNTYIPLDIVWINSENEIVDIVSLSACDWDNFERYNSFEKASFVLEINRWLTKELWINIWDKIEFRGITFINP